MTPSRIVGGPIRRAAALGLIGCVCGACGGTQLARGTPRPLPPDSAALLELALGRVRPAFATQQQAIRTGVYRNLRGGRSVEQGVVVGRAEGAYLIQVGAYRDRSAAEAAHRDVRHAFPESPSGIVSSSGWHRLLLGPWPTLQSASAALPDVSRIYPEAWLRTGPFP